MNASDLIQMMRSGIPWGFTKFDDETMAVIATNSGGLRRWLMMGVNYRAASYFVGCPKDRHLFDRLVSPRYRRVVEGDILDADEFRDGLVPYMKDREVVWVGSGPIPTPFPVTEQLKIEDWDDFVTHRNRTFPEKSVVLVDAGVIGTAIAYRYFLRNQRCTVIDVKGVWTSSLSSLQEADPA